MRAHSSLIADLEGAINSGSQDRRVDTLRRVTDLFLVDAERMNEAQIAVFDDVLCHLIKKIEIKAVAELSARLAPVDNAPIEAIRTLARDNEITVAGPVLASSRRLTTHDLVEIVQTKSQAHLLAISGRSQVEEAVTDQLLQRGDSAVTYKLAENAGARFSETGFTTLATRAETDEVLTKRIGSRLDLPAHVLQELLSKATEAVRQWLLSHAPTEARDEIQRVLADISEKIGREATAPRDFTRAQELAVGMQSRGELDEAAVRQFAVTRKYEEVVAALSVSCSAPIQLIAALMKSPRGDGLLVPCKAAGFEWPTVTAILKNRIAHHLVSGDELARTKADYQMLSKTNAQRTLRFWQVRTATVK
jgi:Uncharacterised protein conserved in bacteria (DUF2336)